MCVRQSKHAKLCETITKSSLNTTDIDYKNNKTVAQRVEYECTSTDKKGTSITSKSYNTRK